MSGISLATKGVLVDAATVVNVLECRIKAVITQSSSVTAKITRESDVTAKIITSSQIKATVSCE